MKPSTIRAVRKLQLDSTLSSYVSLVQVSPKLIPTLGKVP